MLDSALFVVRFVRLSLGVEEEEEAANRGAVEVPLTVISASMGIHFVLSAFFLGTTSSRTSSGGVCGLSFPFLISSIGEGQLSLSGAERVEAAAIPVQPSGIRLVIVGRSLGGGGVVAGELEELLGREGFGVSLGSWALRVGLEEGRDVADLVLERGVGRGAGEGTTAAANCSFLMLHTLSFGTGAGAFSSTASTVGADSAVGRRQLSDELEE